MENLTEIYQKIKFLLDVFKNMQDFVLNIKKDNTYIENIEFCSNLLGKLSEELKNLDGKLPTNYFRIFLTNLIEIESNIKFKDVYGANLEGYDEDHIDHLMYQVSNVFHENSYIFGRILNISFHMKMFGKFNYLSGNLVAIGANGSGKSTLSEYLKDSFGENGQIISAQKILIIPTFLSVSNVLNAKEKLRGYQVNHNNFKSTYNTEDNGAYSLLNVVGGEFQALLASLLSERTDLRNKYCDILLAHPDSSEEVPISKLDRVFEIWNSLIPHREIYCDGVNIYLKDDNDIEYEAYLMSDGEKVALYHIAHIIQAPHDGFIIIDEPEMYLHKSILNKLWDILEYVRSDCIFMYLTHDVDFASTRYNSKKLWIKSFDYPSNWDIEEIPDNNNLPENLLFELLGSRKNILFCEGEMGKIDDSIYNILFPNYTIKPVKFCHSVINYTKAFNMLGMTTTKAYGIIDSDHNSLERLESLKSENIFSLDVAEAENLLLDENFLKLFAKHFMIKNYDDVVDNIKKEIIDFFEKNKCNQAANFISSEIDFYFKESNINKGETDQEVKQNYSDFISKISIEKQYDDRIKFLDGIIIRKDYKQVLQVFNHKGIKGIVERNFKIRDFEERAILFLKSNEDAKNIIRSRFDEILW